MRSLTRREFCVSAAFAAAALQAPAVVFGGEPNRDIPKLEKIDRQRILTAADRYLHQPPVTITAFSSPRSAGGAHDYFSEGDYWWPDPKSLSGPYIRRDGMSNPDNFTAHRHALIRLSLHVPALTAAWLLTLDTRYAAHAAKHLRAWFLDPATLMHPNLQYAQAVHGITSGRGTGIIDTIHLVEVVRSSPYLEKSGALASSEMRGLRGWFAAYLDWMTTSKNGQEERDAKNNHGTCWLMQVSEFAAFTSNQEQTDFCRQRFKEVLVPEQIAANGFVARNRTATPFSISTSCPPSARFSQRRKTIFFPIHFPMAAGSQRRCPLCSRLSRTRTRGHTGTMSSTSTIGLCANPASSLRESRCQNRNISPSGAS